MDIDETGRITPLKPGNVSIYATQGEAVVEKRLTVKANPTATTPVSQETANAIQRGEIAVTAQFYSLRRLKNEVAITHTSDGKQMDYIITEDLSSYIYVNFNFPE